MCHLSQSTQSSAAGPSNNLPDSPSVPPSIYRLPPFTPPPPIILSLPPSVVYPCTLPLLVDGVSVGQD